MKSITIEKVHHRGEWRLLLRYNIDAELTLLLKQLAGFIYSKTHRCWHIAATHEQLQILKTLVRNKAILEGIEKISFEEATSTKKLIEAINLDQGHIQKIQQFSYWMRSKRYSESTIGTYTDALRIFLRFYSGKAVAEINNEDIVRFNNEYVLAQHLSASYQNQVVNAIKLFFKTVENKNIDIDSVHRPKREKVLPNVLSKEEVKAILNAPRNIKHKAMLSLIYSCGLRCGELLNLRPEHIDSKRGLVIIRKGKGKKDRIVPLSDKILGLLREYYKACKPINFLFEGQQKGEKYDERSLQNVLKQSIAKVGISKPVTLHWLRHSYATHLLESGTDLRYIQELLGHSRSSTTEIYTHVSNKQLQKITSPFDTL